MFGGKSSSSREATGPEQYSNNHMEIFDVAPSPITPTTLQPRVTEVLAETSATVGGLLKGGMLSYKLMITKLHP